MYRVGYRNVIDKGAQLNADGVETHVMMETTGHGALKENYFLDDGAYMVVKIIIEMVRMRLAGLDGGVGSLIKDLEEPAESVLFRMDIVGEPKNAKQRGVQAVETFKNYIEEGKLNGWVLDDCGDCSVDQGCLVDNNDHPMMLMRTCTGMLLSAHPNLYSFLPSLIIFEIFFAINFRVHLVSK
ncbi:hypothetical protein ACQ4PT_044210 [Festuca glaucescens]